MRTMRSEKVYLIMDKNYFNNLRVGRRFLFLDDDRLYPAHSLLMLELQLKSAR